jgi:DNA-binding beta-propeller fold protein YncE
MRKARAKRIWLAGLCVGLLALCVASAAQAGPTDPLLVYTPRPPANPLEPKIPPPTGYLEGPCGIAVDSTGRIYVSDYYHHVVDLYGLGFGYESQIAGDPQDGPCGLAVDGSGRLYVNDYHRSVERDGEAIDQSHPTGVAVDPATGDLYVDDRTYIAHYEAPITPGEEPVQRIGEGTLHDGYGLAFSGYGPTEGRLYVADAAEEKVKVYDPALSTEDPVEVIDGHALSAGHFTSLRDSALAVDRVTGELYVADDLQPSFTERPQAQVDVFGPAGAYEGHLKYLVTDALPPGLAVDNSAQATQGRVYVTSGNTVEASVYVYPPGAATTSTPICQKGAVCPAGAASQLSSGGAPEGASVRGEENRQEASSPVLSATPSSIAQKGSLRLSVNGNLSPKRLPRKGSAPISVSVGWTVSTTDGTEVPKLKALSVDINRHGKVDATGLPTCPYARIQPASSQRALANCRASLVGQGSFSADIALKDQEAYATNGKLLVFNGKSHGKEVLFGQIYSPRPFATSFVIVFKVQKIARGAYGTRLSAALPKALSAWGNLTGIQMTLSRRYAYAGERRSYLSAGCPAPKGAGLASFKLARTEFAFGGGERLASAVAGSCRVR